MATDTDFAPYIRRWALVPDGNPIVTHSSRLLPVLHAGAPAMLKVATEAEERWGAGLMIWWGGLGAARVLAHDDRAILLERATGRRSLVHMAQNGADDEASRIICKVVGALHEARTMPPLDLIPLEQRFQALEAAPEYANLFCNPDHAVATARGRLAQQVEVVARTAQLERGRLLHWILAWAGLSATWLIEDGEEEHVAPTLEVANIAAAEIDKN